jgi:hypothetical protein
LVAWSDSDSFSRWARCSCFHWTRSKIVIFLGSPSFDCSFKWWSITIWQGSKIPWCSRACFLFRWRLYQLANDRPLMNI